MAETTYSSPEPERQPERVLSEKEATELGLGRMIVRMPDGDIFETIGNGEPEPLTENE